MPPKLEKSQTVILQQQPISLAVEPVETTRVTFVDLFKKWGAASTIHAVRNIIESKYMIVKIMWLLCLICSTSYCSYTVVMNLISFLEYNVLTNSQIVYFTDSEFPAVTFCYIDWCDPDFIGKLTEKEDGFIGIEPPEVYSNDPNSKYGYVISREAIIYSISNRKSKKNLSDIVVSCYFNGIQCDLEADFFSFSTEKATCYTFNSGKRNNGAKVDRRSTKFGKKNGLQVEFYSKSSDYCTFKASSGISAFIHHQSQIVTSEDEGIEVGVGYETNIGLERTFIKKYSSKNSYCVDNLNSTDSHESKFFKRTIQLNDIYNQKFCFQLRCQQEILETCNCFDPINERSAPRDGEPVCLADTMTQYTCPNLIKEAFYSNDYFINYESDCPKECESVLYHQYVSTIEYPSFYYAQFLATNKRIIQFFDNNERASPLSASDARQYDGFENRRLSHQDLRKSLLAVNVYYNSDSYQQITEKLQKSFENLISDFGGQTGLFLGEFS